MASHIRGRHRRPSQVKKVIGKTGGGITVAGVIVATAATAAQAQPVYRASPAAFYPAQRITAPHIVTAAVTTVTVRSGNSLSEIAQDHCGTPQDWTGIYDANTHVIGGDPDLIIAGQQLVLSCKQGWAPKPPVIAVETSQVHHNAPAASPQVIITERVSGGNLSFSGLERLWESAGGPSWAASSAAAVAECESGGRQYAYNPSGASGYWQILGEVVPGNVYDPAVNAANAVSKFRASGDTFAQWVCKP